MHNGGGASYGQPHQNGHSTHNGYYAPQPPASYGGPVYYQPVSHGGDVGQHAAYDNRKRGFEALNDFFGDAKRRQIDPNSYSQVGQRLVALSGMGAHLVASDYIQAPAMVAVGGGGHGGPSNIAHGHIAHAPHHQYALPPMPNLRTKNDLLNIDQFLEQMQTTVYENPNHAAAAGVQQAGSHYIHAGVNFRQSQSPPHSAIHNLMSSHLTSGANTTPMMATSSSQSNSSGTPALTPPSSTMSYTSGHSPVQSLPSIHGMSPVHHSSAAYPSLPSVSQGYSPHSNTAPASTLGTNFDIDQRRRFSGGMLQKSARPRFGDEMSVSDDGSTPSPTRSTPTGEKIIKTEVSASNIDPALSGITSPGAVS